MSRLWKRCSNCRKLKISSSNPGTYFPPPQEKLSKQYQIFIILELNPFDYKPINLTRMKKNGLICLLLLTFPVMLELGCHQNTPAANNDIAADTGTSADNGGFKSEIDWGKHLVMISGCNDCHTPKMMTAQGPVSDTSLLLSGHPSTLAAPDVNRKEIEGKGFALTSDMTSWVGPWGISYAYNLTPDPTGIGGWTEVQFGRALREGKYMGSPDGRQLLPPMPWEDFAGFTDKESKAIFAYLQSIKPIHNIIHPVDPPAMSEGGLPK
jgi:hypothetical protein